MRDNGYAGAYQTPFGAYTGWIQQRGIGHLEFFIYDPPQTLRRHSHWNCFIDRGENWYLVHMSRKPADMSSGIMTIERLITESFED